MGGWISSFFSRKPPQTPVNFPKRLKNLTLNQFKGIIGILVPLIAFSWQFEKDNINKCIEQCWLTLTWFLLVHPVSVPMCGLFPIFFLPLCGVMRSQTVCKAYFGDNMILLIIGGMVHQLWNNSGLDRRIALSMLSSGPASSFTADKLLYKASVTSFLLSIFSNKLLVTSYITQTVTSTLMPLETGPGKKDYSELRYVVNNGVQTSSSIGSIVILHGSIAVIAAKMCYDEGTRVYTKYDTFNYLQYSAVSIIAAIFMQVGNLIVHFAYLKMTVKTTLSDASKTKVKDSFMKLKKELKPSITNHEFLTLFFSIVFWALLFTRSAGSWEFGWSLDFGKGEITDSCVCAGMLILLSVLPKGLGFMKYITANKKSELPPLKPESSIIFWRFINKNTIYGYIFLLGAGAALTRAACKKNPPIVNDQLLMNVISENAGTVVTNMDFSKGLLIVIIVAVILPNVMTSAAAAVIYTPFVLCATALGTDTWLGKYHIVCLAAGHGTTLGFVIPFLHTPAYFCHHVGKVPILKMLKISFLSLILCMVMLWAAMVFIAPLILPVKDVDLAAAIAAAAAAAAEAGGGEKPGI